MSDLVLAVDQGTSATKALLVGRDGNVVARASVKIGEAHPAPGWVEQSAEEIHRSVKDAIEACLNGHDVERVAAVGLSTQRESLVLWERASGTPLGPMLSWQDQRTEAECTRLRSEGVAEQVRAVSGLPLDPMFSALKARWLLDHYDPARTRSARGELRLGTVDSWLLGRCGAQHLIEVGNAARTQLLDVRARRWDPTLLDVFGVPIEVLPAIAPSQGPFPSAGGLHPALNEVPIAAVMGDSHAALFGHAGWRPGQVKATYGTGSSVMGLLPEGHAEVPGGMCLTIAWDAGTPAYALEGNIRATGATLMWLANFAGTTPAKLAELAATAQSDGVHIVPGFTGLGAPWWDGSATGLLSGLTLGTGVAQAARAAFESIAFQVEDVVATMNDVTTLLADGGPAANPVLMQLQADTSGRIVQCAESVDLSALGAAHLAGLTAGIWSWSDLEEMPRARRVYTPREAETSRRARLAAWHRALARSRYRMEET
ncbi:glycerol kinase [Pendulispora brunnea]|uniref:Glycerol kinase n=1 Tax=Pendulispora brunnea TaxID=2905690 RepID=A0ABZ2KL78_9BACT